MAAAMDMDSGPMDTDGTVYESEAISADEIEAQAALMTAESGAELPGSAPSFPPVRPSELGSAESQFRRIGIPAHRMNPLRDAFADIVENVTQRMKLQIRVNAKLKAVEIRTSEATEYAGALQKAADYVHAFLLGFDLRDAEALLRLDDLYIDTFEIADVKPLAGDHLSRAIGRISGRSGATKYTLENATKTRIVLADRWIHILGSYASIAVARRAVCALIMGTPPSKVYGHLRAVAARSSGF